MLVHQEATEEKIGLYQAWGVGERNNRVHQSLKTASVRPHLILWLESARKVLMKLNTPGHLHVGGRKSYNLSVFLVPSPSLMNFFTSIRSDQTAAEILIHTLVASRIDFCNSLLRPSLTKLFWGSDILWIQQVLQAWQHLTAWLPAPFRDSQYPAWLLLWF